MTGQSGHSYGLIGALVAFPLRLVAVEAGNRGFAVHRGIRRRSSHLVVDRRLLASADRSVEARLQTAIADSRPMLSENGFLRELQLLPAPTGRTVDGSALLAQSGLAETDFAVLRLLDAFECDSEPFTFRDIILARKYVGLASDGSSPIAIARSVHRSGSVASLTARTLRSGRSGAVYAQFEEGIGELSGQLLLGLGEDAGGEEALFAQAEALEEQEDFRAAAELYGKYLALDPQDAAAAFNRANCLRAAGETAEAASQYLRTLKIDPGFAEAWFNLADLKADQNLPEDARRHLRKAIALDPDYADAIYNLARLEFEADNLVEARGLWEAYLRHDSTSDWAKTAMRGIQYADMQAKQKSAG